MSRIENPGVKRYIVNFAISKLNNCDLFVKVYGRNFAKSRLDINLDKVYTNEENEHARGYYRYEESSVTICESGKDGKILTSEDIEQNSKTKATVLHELIHAILRRTKLECQLYGIEAGTGIHEGYKNGIELGRGLNEGLTNWICKKAGVNITGYRRLTNFINILELANGEENIMRLGKGNVQKNMPSLLGVSKETCLSWLSKTDHIYILEEQNNFFIRTRNILKDYMNIDNLPKEEREKVVEKYVELQRDPDYAEIIYDNPEYQDYLEQIDGEDTIEEELDYIDGKIEELESQIEENTSKLLTSLFRTYFKSEIEEALTNRKYFYGTYAKIG